MKRLLLVALALLLALGFIALGAWQVERRAWKLDLIARVDAGLKAPPAPAPAQLTAWRDVPEYRKVRLTGRYLFDRDTLVKAVTVRGPGFWVVTPLRTERGIVLVNRGFVPDPTTPRHGPDTDTAVVADVVGLVRLTEPGGAFLRDNEPARDRWYSRDVAAIARNRGLGPVAPVFVDADASPNPGGYPVGGLTVVRFRNNHLIYALTWFGLAGLSALGAALLLRGNRL